MTFISLFPLIMQSLDYFESGNLCDHHFTSSFSYFDTILQRPYILCNPSFYTSRDYIHAWPEEFEYPDLFTYRELPRRDKYMNKLLTHESRHKPVVLKLHKLSDKLDKNIGVLINSCFNATSWRDMVDNYFVYYGFFPDNVYPFLDIYHDELISIYRPNWKIPRYNSPISEFNFTTALEDMYINKPNPIVPRVMRCFNTVPCEVEPTIFEGGSVVTGSVRIAQGLWNFMTCKEETNSKIKNAIERWMLELLDLAINCSVGKILMSFVKLIGEFVSVTGMLEKLQNITMYCYKYLCDSIKSTLPQPQSSEVVEPTFGSTAFTLQSYDNVPALASSFAAGAVIFASLFIVKNIGDKPNKNVFESLADGFHSIAKYKNGISAVISMVREFSSYVYEAFFQMLIGEREGCLYQRIMLTNVPDIEGCNKEDFFVYVEYLLNPANLLEINRSETLQNQIRFCISILESISKYCAENPQHSMPSTTKEYVNKLLTSLHSLWKEVSKRPIVDSVRFCPFWINLIGESGLGKSTFVPILSNYIRDSLLAIGTDFQLTSSDNWMYPMNFTDKYLTHYNGQYIMTIDDFLQDAPGTLETSTALSLISFVSAVPYYTVQAAISDKGTPFTSKIIISTSNDTGVHRKEIICPDALRNRIRMNILIERKSDARSDDVDPLFKTRCVFKLVKPGTNQAYKTYDNSMLLIRDIVTQYVDWYNLQQRILSSRNATPENVAQIAQHVINHLNRNEEPEAVQPTASWRCLMHLQPTITPQISRWDNTDLILEQYDCDCDHHSFLNESYHKYMRVVGMGKALPLDKFMNYENSQMHKQLVAHKSQFTLYRESCVAMCDKIWNAPRFKWIATILASITACAAAYLLRDSFSVPQKEEEVEDTKVQYNISKPGRIAPRIVKVEATQNVEEIEPILANTLNKQAYDLAYNGILNRGNICTLAFKRNNQLFTGTALRIGGRAILTNDHFFKKMEDVKKFEILIRTNSGLQRLEQIYNPDMYRKLGEIDAGIYLCDGSLSQSKSLVKHFCMDNVLANYVEAMVLTLHPKNHVPMVMTNVIAEPNLTTHQYEVGGEVYYTLNSYKTNCRVEKGMSGSILLATSNGIKNKILGIQTCRNINDETGYFKPISQNMINKALDSLGVMATLEPAVEETCFATTVGFEKPPNLGNGRLEYLGGLPKNKTVRGQTETKIRESLIHDVSSRTQEPSVLDDKDMRMDPSLRGKPILYRAMEGFDHDIGSVDTKLLSTCVDELAIEYDVTLDIPSIPRRLLSDLEMVNGVPGVINRVEMKSSPGYPYVLERKDTTKGGKFEWFNEEPPQEGYTKVYSMKPSLASGLEQREQALLSGKQFPTIAYACLKDETRPLAKITNGKTRAFICLPLDFNLLIRKYFGAFIAALHSKAGKVTSCVGIDPAKQWREVYDKLIAVNCLWEDFDYANWDQHLHPELVLRVANIVNYWYGDLMDSPAGKLRYLLLDTLVHTTIIVKDRVFCKSCGQCSGCAITAELNCLVHDILMYYMWRKVALKENFETHLQHYRDNVASIMYGDDIVIAVTPEFQTIFNGEQLSPLMAELGMNITPGDKVSTKFVTKAPSDIYFLKRNFIKDGDFVKAPLRPDIVENIFQWIHKSDNDIDATLNNCETALREAYMHGRTYFDSLLTKINGRIKDYNRKCKGNLKPVVFSYDSFDEKYRDEDFSCAGLDAFAHVQS